MLGEVGSQLLHGLKHTVALGFAGDVNEVVLGNEIKNSGIDDAGGIGRILNFRSKDAVVLDARNGPLEDEVNLGTPGGAVKREGLGQNRHEIMTHGTKHSVLRPDHEIFLGIFLESWEIVAN